MSVLIFLFTAYGITNIVVFSHLFTKLRDFFNKINPGFLGEVFSCPLCFSTWVGFTLSYILTYIDYTNLTPFGSLGLDNLYLRIFLDGCLTSGSVWIIHTIQEYFEK